MFTFSVQHLGDIQILLSDVESKVQVVQWVVLNKVQVVQWGILKDVKGTLWLAIYFLTNYTILNVSECHLQVICSHNNVPDPTLQSLPERRNRTADSG